MCPKPTAAVEPKVQYFQLCEKEVRKEGYKIITVSMFVREVWNTVYLSHMYTHQKYITKWSGGFSVQKAQFLNYIMRSFTLSGLHLRDLMWGWEFHLRVFSWGLLYLKRTCHSGLASTWEASLECCLLHCDQMRSAPSLLFSLSPPLVFFVFFLLPLLLCWNALYNVYFFTNQRSDTTKAIEIVDFNTKMCSFLHN